jgi:hypothetical protein
MGNFLATLDFPKHRKVELQRSINNIFFNLQIGEKEDLKLPRTPAPIWEDRERLAESSYPLGEYDRDAGSELAYTVGMMDLLDYLRSDIPIRSFNLWISMKIEGAGGLLKGQHPIPWITAFQALPIQEAKSFRISTPDAYDAMRKKHVLALVLSILSPDTIRTKAWTKYDQAVSGGTA